MNPSRQYRYEQGEDPLLEICEPKLYPPDLDLESLKRAFLDAQRTGHWEVLNGIHNPLMMHEPGFPWYVEMERAARPNCLPGCTRVDGHDGRDPGACMKDGVMLDPPPPTIKGIAALRVVLAKLRYKEGWKFELTEPDQLHVTSAGSLTIMFPAEDAVNRGLVRDQGMTTSIPRYPDFEEVTEERWVEWLFGVILFIEIHEAAEFFNVASKEGWQRPFDPHPNQRIATEIAARGLPRHL